MKDLTFPIVEINENKLISSFGSESEFFKLTPPDLEQLDGLEKKNFFNSISSILNNLDEMSFFKFYRINGQSYLNTDSKDLNLENIHMTPENKHMDLFFGSEEIFSNIDILDDGLLVNGKYKKVLSVKGFSEDLMNENIIPKDVDYVLSIKKINQLKAVKILERIRSNHQSSFLKSKRDIKSEGAYGQAEELLYDLTHGEESLFEMEMYFVLSSDTAKEVNQMASSLYALMATRGITIYLEGQSLFKAKSGLDSIFHDLIPGVKPRFKHRSLTNKTGHLQYLLPFNQSHLMEQSPSSVMFHDQNNEEIYFDPFTQHVPNKNMLVTGTSGRGKSVFVGKLIHHLISNYPTLIIDKGGSFKKLTLYHGGVELDSKFNPLQFKDPIYLREFILSMVDSERFNKLERGKLLSEIKKYLEENFVHKFFDLLKFLDTSFKGIEHYFEEIKDSVGGISIPKHRILYVDVDSFPKNLISPLIIYLLQYFKSIPQKEKILVFDECWSFLSDHGEFIDECFRTFRKTGAFPIAISQSLEDFKVLGKESSTSITNNSYFKVFFPQEIKAHSEMSEFDATQLNSLCFEKKVFSDFYLKSSDNSYRKVVRSYLEPLEYELLHTESGESDQLYKFLNKNQTFFKSNKEAIDAYIGLKYASDENNPFYSAGSYVWN